MDRIPLDLDPAEYTALSRLAERDLRPVPHEARHLVREALRAAGLLNTPPSEQAAAGAPDPLRPRTEPVG